MLKERRVLGEQRLSTLDSCALHEGEGGERGYISANGLRRFERGRASRESVNCEAASGPKRKRKKTMI